MLVLVMPQTYTYVPFFLIWDFILVLLLKFLSDKLVSEGLKKYYTFWLASARVETEIGHATGCCMPCYLRWEMLYHCS